MKVDGRKTLAVINPQLSDEWDKEKNGDLTPNNVTASSGIKAWWKCPNGHVWSASVANRSKGKGCPYCANRRVLKGYNDLATIRPLITMEWDWEKNNGITPYEVLPSTGKKYWWRCHKGHSWEESPNSRAKGYGCPVCSKERKTSFPERIIYYYIKQYFPDAVESERGILDSKRELDIYIPSQRVAIEYDGERFHEDPNRDIEKDIMCENKGVTLYRIRERNCPKLQGEKSKSYYTENYTGGQLEIAIKWLLLQLGISKASIHIEDDLDAIYEMAEVSDKTESLACQYPELAEEWNSDRNGKLTPDNVNAKSGRKVWWKCKKYGHEWQSKISNRTSNKQGCPYCSIPAKKVMSGFNDLKTVNPNLAEQWDYSKNKNRPDDVLPGSQKKAWWICNVCGNSWEAVIASRAKGAGCPFCRGYYVSDKNCLAVIKPGLADEWDYERNSPTMPYQVSIGTPKKFWWKCRKYDHSFLAGVDQRVQGSGCSICAGKVVLAGFNDLESSYPDIAVEWDVENNGQLKPNAITPKSQKSVWWKCKRGHSWKSTVHNRTVNKQGCPYCAGKKPITGENDFATLYSDLMVDWDYQTNNQNEIYPTQLTAHSGKTVAWICHICGFNWTARVCDRTSKNRKCPQCKGKK